MYQRWYSGNDDMTLDCGDCICIKVQAGLVSKGTLQHTAGVHLQTLSASFLVYDTFGGS
jgi:hypothetical protein